MRIEKVKETAGVSDQIAHRLASDSMLRALDNTHTYTLWTEMKWYYNVVWLVPLFLYVDQSEWECVCCLSHNEAAFINKLVCVCESEIRDLTADEDNR